MLFQLFIFEGSRVYSLLNLRNFIMIQEWFCDGFSCVNEDLLELHMKSHTRHIEKVFRRYGYSYVHL